MIPRVKTITSAIVGIASALALLACQENLGPETLTEEVERGKDTRLEVASGRPGTTSYHVVPIGNLGGAGGGADGINSRNEVVGVSRNSGGQLRAFLWSDGTIEELEGLGGSMSGAYAISNRGLIVGEAENAEGDLRAVLWVDGEPVDLGTLGGSTSQALAINNRGQVVGRAQTAEGAFRAFIWWRGKMEELPVPADDDLFLASAHGINNAGDAVGTSAGVGQDALLWSKGQPIVLETDCHEAAAFDINGRGQIVGGGLGCEISPVEVVPLLWNGDRTAHHLEPLGGLQEVVFPHSQNTGDAFAINSRGEIVGWSDADARTQFFEQRATLWYRDEVVDLGGGAESSARDINRHGVAVGSASEPVLFVPESRKRLLADRTPEGANLAIEGSSEMDAGDDLVGSRSEEAWAVRLCETKGSVNRPPTVSDILAGC